MAPALSGAGTSVAASPPAPQEERAVALRRARIAYGAMAAGLFLYIVTVWLQVFIDTRQARTVSVDALSESHRHWRLRSTLLFLIWSVLGALTLPIGLGWLFLIPAWVWYAYRILRGALCYRLGRPPVGVLARPRAARSPARA